MNDIMKHVILPTLAVPLILMGMVACIDRCEPDNKAKSTLEKPAEQPMDYNCQQLVGNTGQIWRCDVMVGAVCYVVTGGISCLPKEQHTTEEYKYSPPPGGE